MIQACNDNWFDTPQGGARGVTMYSSCNGEREAAEGHVAAREERRPGGAAREAGSTEQQREEAAAGRGGGSCTRCREQGSTVIRACTLGGR